MASKGYIRRKPSRSRAIELLTPIPPAVETPKNCVSAIAREKIPAGQPILALENIEDVFPSALRANRRRKCFHANVKGNSMIEAGIFENDYLIVRPQEDAENGDIVVALLDDEATVKYFYREKDHIKLVPANSSMEPIYVQSIKILGKVGQPLPPFLLK